MKSVMSHRFSEVPKIQRPRSVFDRSHAHKTTFNSGYLIPILVDEALPGDTFKMNASILARLSAPITPVMDNIFIDTFFFAVPNRLLWDNWQRFNGEQDSPGASTDYVVPRLEANPATGFPEASVQDYMGVPTKVTAPYGINAFPSRAYNLIWNEWFRDQNIQASAVVDTDDGPDAYGDYEVLRKRGKRHDYFTSCLPWPQKGDAVEIPLGSTAPVFGDGNSVGWTDGTNFVGTAQDNSNKIAGATEALDEALGHALIQGSALADDKAIGVVRSTDGHESGLIADLSQATAATINTFRLAFQTQKMLERDARGGTRYTEIIRSHFGVISPDFRLQRPEFLGGGTQRVGLHQVPQTSETGTTPQANLAAFGIAQGNRNSFSKSFTEHCTIIGLVCARADLTYQQGLNRMWLRSTRYDYYWPAFAHLGEQPVTSIEIYSDGTGGDGDVFGYQERWSEYRYKPSIITGNFRSNATDSLDVWHLSQDFESRPLLNNSFIKENPPLNRVLAVEGHQFYCDIHFNYICARPMPTYSVPGMIDHF